MSIHLAKNFRSPFPALNIPRWQEYVATGTVYANTLAIYCGQIRAQFHCGTDSQVCDAY